MLSGLKIDTYDPEDILNNINTFECKVQGSKGPNELKIYRADMWWLILRKLDYKHLSCERTYNMTLRR